MSWAFTAKHTKTLKTKKTSNRTMNTLDQLDDWLHKDKQFFFLRYHVYRKLCHKNSTWQWHTIWSLRGGAVFLHINLTHFSFFVLNDLSTYLFDLNGIEIMKYFCFFNLACAGSISFSFYLKIYFSCLWNVWIKNKKTPITHSYSLLLHFFYWWRLTKIAKVIGSLSKRKICIRKNLFFIVT